MSHLTATATANVIDGEIAINAGEDTDILHHNGRVLGLAADLEPWGEEEFGMERADAALADMGWRRVSDWEGQESLTCQVQPLDPEEPTGHCPTQGEHMLALQQVADQIAEQVTQQHIEPLRDLLGPREELDLLADAARQHATLLAAQLMGEDDKLASQTAIDLVNTIFADGAPIPDDWWTTPLGRQVARSVGYPGAEAVSQSLAASLLGVTQQRVSAMLREGKLERHPEHGGVATASIRHWIARR